MATARPYSSRKTCSTEPAEPGGMSLLALGLSLKGAHFDGQGVGAIGEEGGELAAPGQRGVEVWRPDDQKAADVLFAFGVWTVGGEQVAVLEAHDRGCARCMQRAVEDPRARGF